MKEKDFQVEFGKHNKMFGVFELKLCKGKSLPFDCLADHQEKALLDAYSTTGLYHKITDQPFLKGMTFQRKKPFDCFNLRDVPAFVVVMWWIAREKKMVYYIPIGDWITVRDNCGRKSLTEDMAAKIAPIAFDYRGIK